jgi:hypothetical protein
VSFDSTKHLSDASIRKRQLERQKLQELEQQREEQKRREKEAEERQRAEERCVRPGTPATVRPRGLQNPGLSLRVLPCICRVTGSRRSGLLLTLRLALSQRSLLLLFSCLSLFSFFWYWAWY